MFDHFSFLLENSNILLSRPSLRGSTPLDVAYSSLMENTELALALRYLRIKLFQLRGGRGGISLHLNLLIKTIQVFNNDLVKLVNLNNYTFDISKKN